MWSLRMKTKIFVPTKEFWQVDQAIKNSGVRYFPYHKLSNGYEIEFEPADHPLVTYLTLKYDINIK